MKNSFLKKSRANCVIVPTTLGAFISPDACHPHHPDPKGVQCPDVHFLNTCGQEIHLRDLCSERRHGLVLINVPRLTHPCTPFLMSQLEKVQNDIHAWGMSLCALCTEPPDEIVAWHASYPKMKDLDVYSARHHVCHIAAPMGGMESVELFLPCFVLLDHSGHILDVQLIRDPADLAHTLSTRIETIWG